MDGVLELCRVLIEDQTPLPPPPSVDGGYVPNGRHLVRSAADIEQLAEEQGWVARIVHLFRAEQLDVQYELFRTARKHFERGGDRMRFTFPSLITAAIALARRYKQREHEASTRARFPWDLADEVVGTGLGGEDRKPLTVHSRAHLRLVRYGRSACNCTSTIPPCCANHR